MGFPMANAVIRRLQGGANPRQGSAEARAAIDGHHGGPRSWRAFRFAPALRVAVRGDRANHREHDSHHRGGEEVARRTEGRAGRGISSTKGTRRSAKRDRRAREKNGGGWSPTTMKRVGGSNGSVAISATD